MNGVHKSLSLAGKIAVITGGSKGIGKATAAALVGQGAKVVINYGRDSDAAEAVVKELGAENTLAVQADAGSMKGVETIVNAAVEKFSKIDIVVANAGWMPMKDVEHTTEEDFDRIYALNVKGPYFLVQKALPHMGPGSAIILLSTSLCHASSVQPGYTLYCSTKGAIEQMTRLFSKSLAGKEMQVNCVAPGPTATDLFMEGKNEQMIKMISGLSPRNRLGQPDEIADSIVYLASPGARWVTGQVLKVNGGMV